MKFKLFLLSLVFFIILGKCLDLEAERAIEQFYFRHLNGIIIGAESIQPKKIHHEHAILLFHGFLETPKVFQKVIKHLDREDKADIYAPLLPYHGRNLQTAAKLNNQVVQDFINKSIQDLSKKYKHVIVVGHSYSGAQLANIINQKQLPQNIYPILYAPAIFIQMNTPINDIRNHLFQLWRNYCNYKLLGCERNHKSVEKNSLDELMNEISLNYKVVSAVQELFKFDKESRHLLGHLNRNYSLIIAKNDNRVSFKEIQKACMQNSIHCKLYTFNDGKHMLHYTHNKQAFDNIILNELSTMTRAEGP